MLYKLLKTLTFSILFTSSFVSCSGELHREGKLLYYKAENNKLYVIYQNDGQNNLFSSGLSPMNVEWEKKISGHPVEPALFILDDYVFCNCKKGKVCLLDPIKGNTAVSVDSSLVIAKDSTGFTVDEGILYTLCNNASICAIDIKKEKTLWEFKLKDGEKTTVQFKIETGFLFYGNNIDEIVALDIKTGDEKYRLKELANLEAFYTFPETVVANFEKIDGFDINSGNSKWVSPDSGKIRCVMDGLIVTQSEEFFSVLFAENGMETWNYPRTGTTFLTCQESLSLAAFTVKDLLNENRESMDESVMNDYFDKVYFFDVTDGEKIFEFKSDEDLRVLNITGFMTDRFYIALEKDHDSHKEITVNKFSTSSWEKEKEFTFGTDKTSEEIYVSLMHADSVYSVFRVTTITGKLEETDFLFKNTGDYLGRMASYPEVITGTNAYDIISYDDYFNIFEKTLPDFLLND